MCTTRHFAIALASVVDTRRNINSIYDFKTGCVKTECLHEGWQTSGSMKVVRMAFNLYCNGTPSVDDYTKTEEQTNITELMLNDFIEKVVIHEAEGGSTKDMELKSLKKKYKSKGFAAGCSREVIERGAKQLGWELEKLLTMTLQAMAASEDTIRAEMEEEQE